MSFRKACYTVNHSNYSVYNLNSAPTNRGPRISRKILHDIKRQHVNESIHHLLLVLVQLEPGHMGGEEAQRGHSGPTKPGAVNVRFYKASPC